MAQAELKVLTDEEVRAMLKTGVTDFSGCRIDRFSLRKKGEKIYYNCLDENDKNPFFFPKGAKFCLDGSMVDTIDINRSDFGEAMPDEFSLSCRNATIDTVKLGIDEEEEIQGIDKLNFSGATVKQNFDIWAGWIHSFVANLSDIHVLDLHRVEVSAFSADRMKVEAIRLHYVKAEYFCACNASIDYFKSCHSSLKKIFLSQTWIDALSVEGQMSLELDLSKVRVGAIYLSRC